MAGFRLGLNHNDGDAMTESELKPCPFCGKAPEPLNKHFRDVMGYSLTHRCKVMGPLVIEFMGRSAEQVAAIWNTRA